MNLSVDITASLGAFELETKFEAVPGVTALFGRSGAGKSSVINMIAGLAMPTSGRISCGGRVLFDATKAINLPAHRRCVGVVFQDARLFPHMSVLRNLTFSSRVGGSTISRDRLDEIVELLGVGGLLHRNPTDLSGGEKQRVAIGRTLLSNPQILLLDEPLAALDEARKQEILPWIEGLRDQAKIPILYVSHQISEVARLADQIVALDNGTVVHAGPVGTVLASLDIDHITGLEEAGSLLVGKVVEGAGDGLSLVDIGQERIKLPGLEAPVGATVRMRVRARDVIVAKQRLEGISIRNQIDSRVVRLSDHNERYVEVVLAVGEQLLRARITREAAGDLDLKEDMPVIALIKTMAFDPLSGSR
ncbi:MAG: molybdenum ABC transporter ATP-binding protein [Pseudomonadota bacterium]